MTETKAALTKRLKSEGRWDDYQKVYERFKATGLSAKDARREAAEHFPPVGQSVAAASGERPDDAVVRRLTAAVAADKDATQREIVAWVFEHASTPMSEIDASDVPSRGAVGMLEWLQTSKSNYHEFIRSIWVRLMPSKSDQAEGDRFADDGRVALDLLADFEQSFAGEQSLAGDEVEAEGDDAGTD